MADAKVVDPSISIRRREDALNRERIYLPGCRVTGKCCSHCRGANRADLQPMRVPRLLSKARRTLPEEEFVDRNGFPILDCHQHLFDVQRLRYSVFAQRSAGFEALVGDHSALPRIYLPEDYERDTADLNVVKTVWAEFISDDPLSEAR